MYKTETALIAAEGGSTKYWSDILLNSLVKIPIKSILVPGFNATKSRKFKRVNTYAAQVLQLPLSMTGQLEHSHCNYSVFTL